VELPPVNGKRKQKRVWRCPYYTKWMSMLKRCYSENSLTTNPTYKGCSVCDEWLTFSNFRRWMETQDWEGKALDKDLLVYQNKVYSPETCCFISSKLNTFLVKSDKIRGDYPLGVSLHSDNRCNSQALVAFIKDGRASKYLGRFKDAMEAHRAWQLAKITYGEILISNQKDPVIISGLQRAINKIKEDYNQNIETKDF
jgi:hypothetical protein